MIAGSVVLLSLASSYLYFNIATQYFAHLTYLPSQQSGSQKEKIEAVKEMFLNRTVKMRF